MTSDPKEALERLKELLLKATPGPWSRGMGEILMTGATDSRHRTVFSTANERGPIMHPVADFKEAEANAALIVAAVNALPALIAEREGLEREVERLTPFELLEKTWFERSEELEDARDLQRRRAEAAEAKLSALQEAARFAASQLDAMVCADCEQHAVYPDPDEPANRLRALLPTVPVEGS